MSRNPNCLPVFLALFSSLLLTSLSQVDFCEDYVTGNQLVVNQPLIDEVSSGAVTLQELVECLTDGGELIFQETLDLGTLRIESAIRIQGSSGEATTSFTCTDGPIFLVNATGVQLSSLKVRDCQQDHEDAPVVLLSGSSLEINSVNFINNTNEAGSAALMMEADSELVVQGCHFNANNGSGGTIHVTDGKTLDISSSTFVNNTAYLGGGALRIESEQSSTTVVIEDGSEFKNNEATAGEGGAILATGNVNVTIRDDTIFKRNRAGNQGGALFFIGAFSIRIEDAFFIENESDFIGGGAIYAANSSNTDLEVRISNAIFSKNAARNHLGSGGAIRFEGSGINCRIENGSCFMSNVAELDGGAIHVSDGLEMNISDVFFLGNEVHQGAGAALYAMSSLQSGETTENLQLQINSSTFIQNRAIGESRGGGAFGFTGSGTVVNVESCRFHENESLHGVGGVLYVFNGPSVSVAHSNFIRNRATRGGSIYAERDATCSLTNCRFYNNEAVQGGVINTKSGVDISIANSDLMNNTASEEGGVIYAESHVSFFGNRARLVISSSTITNNSAAIQTISNALNSVVTRGGAIVAVGAWQYVEITNTLFRYNYASEGGAIAIKSTRSFFVLDESSFESNEAEFGGALYILVDEAVDLSSDIYNVSDAKFLNNHGSQGGAIWIASTSSANGYFPFNADRIKARLRNCTFEENNASDTGGGMMVRGIGIEVSDSNFTRNIALHTSAAITSGSGGAVASMDGARVIFLQSRFQENRAEMSGGALFVNDAAVRASGVNFTQNSVMHKFGTGGAVALELTSSRTLPIFESDGPHRYLMFQCNNCSFTKNTAPLYGGAIYHHLSDPRVNFTKMWNCDDAQNQHFLNMPRGQEHNVSCAWVEGIRERLEQRSIRLFHVTFEENEAQAGAALFTNYRRLINVTNGSTDSWGSPFMNVMENKTFLEDEGIIFKNNKIAGVGYGSDYATFPTKATLRKEAQSEWLTSLNFDSFRSGDNFSFEIMFIDDFGQTVSYVKNFTAELYIVGEGSGDRISPVYGQTLATWEPNKRLNFTSVRLSGKENTTYNVAVRYLHQGQELRMNDTTFVNVTVRPCKIGEVTIRGENNVIECRQCVDGQFSSTPLDEDCSSCRGIEGIECRGNVAIPKDEYWQYSSFSTNVQECISRQACKYKGRNESILEMANSAHEEGRNLSFHKLNEKQCTQGYKGILCGTCNSTHGKEGDQCRLCASRPLRYFLLSLLIFWSLVLVGYFIRSVLQLSKRIEFNKRFGHASAQQETSPLVETLPGASSRPTELGDSEIHPDGIQDLALEMSGSLDGSNMDLLSPQLQSCVNRADPAKGDLTPTRFETRINQRSRTRSRRGHRFEINPRHLWVDRQTHLVSRLHRLKSEQESRNVKPLSLMNPASEVLKIMINFLQVTSVAIYINLTWSEEVRRALAVIGTLANLSTGGGYFSLDCFLEESSMAKSLRRMILLVLYPAFIFLVFVLLWGLRTLIKSKNRRYFKHRIWLAFLSILYIFYTGVTKNLLRFFVCRNIKMDATVQQDPRLTSALSGSFWEEDSSVKCYEDDHLLLIGFFVVPLLCLITIGFPLGTLFILHLKADHLEDENVVTTYGFLYQAYNRHYWEVVIMLRKASIAAVTVFPRRLGANIQGLLCVFVLVVSLACHLLLRPFKKEAQHLNHLESYSLSTTIAVFLSGLVFKDPKTTGASEVLLSVMAIVCVVGTLLLMIFNLLMSSEELIDMKLIENEVMYAEDLLDQRLSFKLAALVMYYFGKIGAALNRSARGASSGRNPVQNQTAGVQMTNRVQNA